MNIRPILLITLMMMISITAGFAQDMKMATTTSLEDSGLLSYLLPEFALQTNIKILPIARGTGAAISEAREGNVDLVFTHARELEEAFVADGYGTTRVPVMYNDFVIVGPANDPCQIDGLKDCLAALKKIADQSKAALFISRGDNSGTHILEKALWAAAETKMPPERYLSVGQGMGRTLLIALEKQAYTLTDRATYLMFNQGKDQPAPLKIMCEGDQRLHNEYAVIPVNPERHKHVNFEAASKFVGWLTSEQGQKMISDFRIAGQQVFFTLPKP
ncbi:MAG: substrate-binding domain-containing protein [Candidatus Rifleibacteriota bacterium]